jgi:hypothetical protein
VCKWTHSAGGLPIRQFLNPSRYTNYCMLANCTFNTEQKTLHLIPTVRSDCATHQPVALCNGDNSFLIITTTTTTTINFMHGIYSYITEMSHVSMVYSVAAILLKQFMVSFCLYVQGETASLVYHKESRCGLLPLHGQNSAQQSHTCSYASNTKANDWTYACSYLLN